MSRNRNRQQTEARILDAIHHLLASEGYAALGINRIAKAANVDKVLIYRYFGGLEGALKAFAQSEAFWPGNDEIIGIPLTEFAQLDYLSQRKHLTIGTLRAMRKRPHTLAALAWEMVETNELTRILAEMRARQNMELDTLLKKPEHPKQVLDTPVVTLILAAAVHYLAISNIKQQPLFGIDPIGWDRIEAALGFIHDGIDLAERHYQDSE